MFQKILLVTHFLVLCCSPVFSASGSAITDVTVTSDYDGVDTYVRKHIPFNITVAVEINLTASGNFSVLVLLKKPHECIKVCNETFWNGTPVEDTCDVVTFLDEGLVSVVTPESAYTDCLEHDDHSYLYRDFVYVEHTGADTTTIVQEVNVTSESPVTFHVETFLFDNTTNVDSQNESLTVNVTGSFLDCNFSTTDGDTEVDYMFKIMHSDDSTETASNVVITWDYSEKAKYPITEATFQVDDDLNDVLNNMTYTQSELTIGHELSITYNTDLNTSHHLELDKPLCIVLLVCWDDGIGHAHNRTFNGCFSRHVDFTDPDAQDIPAELYSGKEFSIERTFTMPKGIMNNIDLVIGLTDADFDTINIDVDSHSLTGPNSLIFAGATNSWTAERRKRDVSSSRVKRAVGSLILTVPLGDVTNPGSSVDLTILVDLIVGTLSQGGVAVGSTSLQYNDVTQLLYYNSSVNFTVPVLTITKVAAVLDDSVRPNILHFEVTVEHVTISNGNAYGVELRDGDSYMDINFQKDFVHSTDDVSVLDDTYITCRQDILALGEEMILSYRASANNDEFPEDEKVDYKATLKWYPTETDGSQVQVQASACLQREDVIIESLLYQHGFTVLGLVCGIIAGALIGVLIVFIIWICRRKMPCVGGVGPMFGGTVRNTDTGLVTSVSETMKRGYADIRNLSKVNANDSIVLTLAQKDKLKQNREMDNMDVIATISVDEEIEKERNGAMIKATHALVAGLRINGDIPKGTQEKCSSKFQKNLTSMEKNLNNEYQKEMEDIFKRMSLKNKAKLAEMHERQKLEGQELNEKLRNSGMSDEEKNELRRLQQKEHQVEQEDINYRLKLEQDEEAEKLRKEYSVRRRMAIKTLQQDYLDDVTKEGKLTDQDQIDWLMKEHYKNQSTLESMYDDEISRQRMLLEEKVARRRALAQKSELQEEAHSDLLNTIASQHLEAIKKTKKVGNLSATEAKQMMAEAQSNMMEIKEKMDTDREKQERALHERLSQRKKEKMNDLAKRQQQEVNDLDKKVNAAMQGEGVDPIGAVQSRQQLLSNQRAEKSELENEVDREHAKELEKLREDVAQKMKEDLEESKEKDMQELTQYGLSDKEMNKILKKHEKDLETLEAQQADDRASQEASFKTKLAAQRKEWVRRKQQEREEQQNLREHEENVVQRLMDNQVAMSEEERNKIMQEHEKQMVKMENSLTLNKLSQKRMLEEKLAKKRAQQMEKLERKQITEAKKGRKGAQVDSDDEDLNTELDLMKKHAEQRIAVLQGEKLSLDDELDEIREAMTKERAAALQEQEVKIAAMLADLQMAKAKEMAKIEEQQKAIFNLKANLMDDLNEKGVLSDPECQRVIKIHQEEQEKLNQKLDSQRSKQEQILRRKLEERLKSKEAQMSRMQETEIRDRMGAAANTPAGKIRRAALLSKHMLEVEKFRNRMDKEINQTLEELRRQNDIRRMNLIQYQELQFINGLVRLGKFDKTELENVVGMLFPTKSEEERRSMLSTLMEGYQAPTVGKGKQDPPQQSKGLSRRTSTLEQRIKSASIARGESASLQGSFRGKKKGKKSRAQEPTRYDEDFDSYSYGNQRPDPIGRSYTPDHHGDQYYDRDFDQSYGSSGTGGYGRTPPSRLPPLEGNTGPVTRKKKKKTRTEPIDEDF